MSAWNTYIASGASALSATPITQQLCEVWNPNSQAVQEFGPTPTATGVAAIIDAIGQLESAVVDLQGG